MNVPFMKLYDSIKPIKKEIEDRISNIIEETRFIGGKEITEFEEAFSTFCSVPYTVGCGNGTDALILALRAMDIGRGDTVLVPANTFIATSEAVTSVGADVAFLDVDPQTHTITADHIEEYCKQNKAKPPKAVIPVHLYGQLAPMKEIMEIAEQYNLKVIEDASQAHGATHLGKGPGHFGDAATFSFYPGKNLGAFGDAGAVVTKNRSIAETVRMLANHGRELSMKYEHAVEGYNMRMDTIQAAILSVKLKHLDTWIKERRNKAAVYSKHLGNTERIEIPVIAEGNEHAWHLYVVQVPNRDRLLGQMKERGISCGIHYPIPLPFQPAYRYKQHRKGDFPVAEKAADTVISIPLWPEMEMDQQLYVIEALGNLILSHRDS